jgi:hypothetical protein
MSPEFREGERVKSINLPCCECGKESKAFASFTEKGENGKTEWLCEKCCEDASVQPTLVWNASPATVV